MSQHILQAVGAAPSPSLPSWAPRGCSKLLPVLGTQVSTDHRVSIRRSRAAHLCLPPAASPALPFAGYPRAPSLLPVTQGEACSWASVFLEDWGAASSLRPLPSRILLPQSRLGSASPRTPFPWQ